MYSKVTEYTVDHGPLSLFPFGFFFFGSAYRQLESLIRFHRKHIGTWRQLKPVNSIYLNHYKHDVGYIQHFIVCTAGFFFQISISNQYIFFLFHAKVTNPIFLWNTKKDLALDFLINVSYMELFSIPTVLFKILKVSLKLYSFRSITVLPMT